MTALPVGRAQIRREGRSGLAILAFGVLADPAQKIAERLDATVVNMRFVKPLDEDLIISVAARHRALVTIEENATLGGAGSAVAELLAAEGLSVPLLQIGIPDRFIEHGSRDTCLAAAGTALAIPSLFAGGAAAKPVSRLESIEPKGVLLGECSLKPLNDFFRRARDAEAEGIHNRQHFVGVDGVFLRRFLSQYQRLCIPSLLQVNARQVGLKS